MEGTPGAGPDGAPPAENSLPVLCHRIVHLLRTRGEHKRGTKLGAWGGVSAFLFSCTFRRKLVKGSLLLYVTIHFGMPRLLSPSASLFSTQYFHHLGQNDQLTSADHACIFANQRPTIPQRSCRGITDLRHKSLSDEASQSFEL